MIVSLLLIYLFRIRWILGFDPAEMVGQKAYEYFHPCDLLATSSCHSQCEYVLIVLSMCADGAVLMCSNA